MQRSARIRSFPTTLDFGLLADLLLGPGPLNVFDVIENASAVEVVAHQSRRLIGVTRCNRGKDRPVFRDSYRLVARTPHKVCVKIGQPREKRFTQRDENRVSTDTRDL